MIKPVVEGWTTNTIQMNKHQLDLEDLDKRVKQLEIVFTSGRGYNYIYEKLNNRISDEVSKEIHCYTCVKGMGIKHSVKQNIREWI